MTDPVPLTAGDGIDRDALAAEGVRTERGLWLVEQALDWAQDYGAFEVESFVASIAEVEREARDRSTPSVDGLREPDQPDPIETFSHPFRAPVNIDGHLFTHTSDCPWPLAVTPTPAPDEDER